MHAQRGKIPQNIKKIINNKRYFKTKLQLKKKYLDHYEHLKTISDEDKNIS
jgi:hypothetical protein